MNSRSILRAAVGLAVLSVVASFSVASALAVTPPTLQLRRVAFDSTFVQFRVSYPAGTAAVSLVAGGVETAKVTVATSTAGTVDVSANMAKATSAVARVYAEDGSLAGHSAALAFAPVRWAPRALKPRVADRQIVGETPVFLGYADARTTVMSVSVDGKVIWKGKVRLDAEGRYKLPKIPLEYGPNAIRIAALNVWGSVSSPKLRLWNLGNSAYVATKRWVLVDKSDLALYVVTDFRVDSVYPVAIGMPGTPTPTGLFILGRPGPVPNAVWGVLRMPLYWAGSRSASSYFIHGTNDSSSIGTMASHGCVRMYNQDVVTFSRTGPGRYVLIRE
jgi:hypothetical protein